MFHDLDAQSDDVHRAARNVVLDVTDDLRRAGAVDAVPGHFALDALHWLMAHRTFQRDLVGFLVTVARVCDRANDVRDHVAGALDQHTIAHADILFRDVIKVVQRGLFDGHTANFHRFQHGIGRQHARAPHVHADVIQLSGYFLRREFQRDRSARVLAHESQLFRQAQIVQLDHHAVDVEGDLVAFLQPAARAGQHFLQAFTALGVIRDWKAQFLQVLQRLPLRSFWIIGHDGIAEDGQRPLRDQCRVQLP